MKINYTNPQTGKPSTVVLSSKLAYEYFKARHILWGDSPVISPALGKELRPFVQEWAFDYFVEGIAPHWHCSSTNKTFTACCESQMLITIGAALDDVYRNAVIQVEGALGCQKGLNQ